MIHAKPGSTQNSGAGHNDETMAVRRVAFYALLLNLGLGIMKGIIALDSKSLAVTAGAIDSGIDAFASLILFAGVSLSTRKTPSFPLGLYKIENLISIIVAFFIFFAGYEIAREIFQHSTAVPRISMTVLLLLLVGIVSIYLFGRYAIAMGKRTGSPTLLAEGRHRQVDVLSSLVVFASVLIDYFKWTPSIFSISIDRIAAAVVLVFIAWAGWGLLSDGMRVLLDASLEFETLDQVRKILIEHPMVVKVQSLFGRNAGRFRFLQASLVLRTDDLQRAHQISETLEQAIREKVPHVERVMIHYEPQPRTHYRIAVPLSDPQGLISDHFGESQYFALLTIRLSDHAIKEQEVIENPHRQVEKAKGIRVAEWLVQHRIDQVFMKEDLSRKGPGYVFEGAGVKMALTEATNLITLMEDIKKNL